MRHARRRLARALLHRMVDTPDAAPTDGGRGTSPFRGPLPAPSDALPPCVTLALTAQAPDIAERLRAWLAENPPGSGAGWDTITVVSLRLIHLAVVRVQADLPTALGRELAGAANYHALHLVREHPFDAGSADAVLCHAALIIAGCAWPELPSGRRWRGPALAGMGRALPQLVGDDGGLQQPLPESLRALWCAALARAFCAANHESFPADGALLRGTSAAWRLGGDLGTLPTGSPSPTPLLPLGDTPVPHTLRNLALVWGLDDGPAGSLPAPVCALLTGSEPTTPPTTMAGKTWSLWSWRDADTCVAHIAIRKRPARVWATGARSMLVWDLADGGLVRGGLDHDGALSRARVDGPAVSIDLSRDDGERRIVLRQARLRVTDTGVRQVRWAIDARWPLAPGGTDDKPNFNGKCGRTQLIVTVDPAWRWALSDEADGVRWLTGEGEIEQVRVTFEVR